MTGHFEDADQSQLASRLLAEQAAPDIRLLKAYTRRKQAIARTIRLIRARLSTLKQDQLAEHYQELMVKLAEDRFTLAVLGQFKRGKSSLMNAVIGRELLPTGVLPLTSAITILRYGPAERLVVIREGAIFPDELPASRLAEFVTERGNPGNVKQVKTARLEVPLAFLRQGLEFVDTPGVGSSIEANTATTYQFLPRCDAAIFVTSVDSPLSNTELEFLHSVCRHVRRLFFVVNKTDMVSPQEQQDILQYVRDSLARLPRDHQVDFFAVSARQGLRAKQADSSEGYETSGLRNLEEALATFLATEKAATFLDSVLDKAIGMLPGSSAPTDANDTADRFWTHMRQRLDEMKSRLRLQEPEPVFAAGTTDQEPAAEAPSPAVNIRPEESSAMAALNLRTRGCPVCDQLTDRMFDFFSKWQYALASEESAQAAFAAAGGFCPLHTWQLVAVASPQGLSVGLPVLIDRLSREMSELAAQGDADRDAASAGLAARCAACRFLRAEEDTAIARLTELAQTETGLAEYRRSQGVCLRHLDMLLLKADDAALRGALLATTARRCEEWAEDMQNYAMKRDAIRRALLNKDEEDAFYRALVHLAGAKSLCLPPQENARL